jgi:hypothetical protein
MLFSGLPPAGLAAIIDSMQPQMATAGKDIIKQVGLGPFFGGFFFGGKLHSGMRVASKDAGFKRGWTTPCAAEQWNA